MIDKRNIENTSLALLIQHDKKEGHSVVNLFTFVLFTLTILILNSAYAVVECTDYKFNYGDYAENYYSYVAYRANPESKMIVADSIKDNNAEIKVGEYFLHLMAEPRDRSNPEYFNILINCFRFIRLRVTIVAHEPAEVGFIEPNGDLFSRLNEDNNNNEDREYDPATIDWIVDTWIPGIINADSQTDGDKDPVINILRLLLVDTTHDIEKSTGIYRLNKKNNEMSTKSYNRLLWKLWDPKTTSEDIFELEQAINRSEHQENWGKSNAASKDTIDFIKVFAGNVHKTSTYQKSTNEIAKQAQQLTDNFYPVEQENNTEGRTRMTPYLFEIIILALLSIFILLVIYLYRKSLMNFFDLSGNDENDENNNIEPYDVEIKKIEDNSSVSENVKIKKRDNDEMIQAQQVDAVLKKAINTLQEKFNKLEVNVDTLSDKIDDQQKRSHNKYKPISTNKSESINTERESAKFGEQFANSHVFMTAFISEIKNGKWSSEISNESIPSDSNSLQSNLAELGYVKNDIKKIKEELKFLRENNNNTESQSPISLTPEEQFQHDLSEHSAINKKRFEREFIEAIQKERLLAKSLKDWLIPGLPPTMYQQVDSIVKTFSNNTIHLLIPKKGMHIDEQEHELTTNAGTEKSGTGNQITELIKPGIVLNGEVVSPAQVKATI